MLVHVPSFGRNARGSPDFLAYPVPKACMHVLCTGVPRCLGVTRSASSPKAAQALGCSLTPGLRISFGRVTCMARAASVPGLWTLGFLLLRGACVWVWVVVGSGFRLRPATPGWGVGVCVRLCMRSACTLPLLAEVCGVCVCGWARVPAAPRHSWLGCRGLCLLVWALCLQPATPGWGVRRGCVCFGSGFGCAPPLLAGVLGWCVCARVRAPLAPGHSWHGCKVWVCVFGLGFRLPPATPGWGVRCGCVCSGSGFGCAPPLLAGVLAVCVLVCALCLHSATLGPGARCGCVCFGSAFGWAPPLLAGVLGCVCACVRAPLAPSHSWHGCAVWVCVFGPGFRLRPATPGCGVGVCVCWCGHSACTPPLLAGVRAVCVCASARVLAAPRHSWLGCWGVCVLMCALRLQPTTPGTAARCGCVCLGSGFGCALPILARVCVVGVCAQARALAAPSHTWLGCWAVCVLVCALRLHPATPGWGARCVCVCLGSGSGCAPPILAWVLGCVCARVRALLAPSHSLLGCAVCVCVFGLRFWLRPATPGWVVRVCVCWCGRSACTLPLLAGVRAVGVCAQARVLAAPRHSWLVCWGVCVLVWALCLQPATPGTGGVCVFGLRFRLRPATPGWAVRCGCVCSGPGFGCTPPLLAGVLGCVCAGVRALLAPRHSWLGCAVWVCVFGLGFRLRPATLGWGVGLCVCSCARSACNQPLLARVRAVGVCVWARVSAAPRYSWLRCALWVCVLGPGFWLRPATPGWGVGLCVCWCARSACTPSLLAGVRDVGVCVWARVSAAPRGPWLGCLGVCVCC